MKTNLIIISLICYLLISSCKSELHKEQPSGEIIAYINGIQRSFTIYTYPGGGLGKYGAVFWAKNENRELFSLHLFDDSIDGNHDFLDPQFKPAKEENGISLPDDNYQANIDSTNKMTILKSDYNTKTIEGNFSFTAQGIKLKKNIAVTNGYFRLKLPDWLYN
jgi:hypothetical protein